MLESYKNTLVLISLKLKTVVQNYISRESLHSQMLESDTSFLKKQLVVFSPTVFKSNCCTEFSQYSNTLHAFHTIKLIHYKFIIIIIQNRHVLRAESR